MKKAFATISIFLMCVMVFASASSSYAADFPRTADGYPNKPIVAICPWTAGGGTDVVLRLIGSFLPKYLGQGLIVDNQTGGAAIPGTFAQVRARPDGYAIGVNTTTTFTLRPLILDVAYTLDDFTFILGVFDQKNMVLVRKDSPFKTLEDLVKYAKANPGKLNYGGSVTGSFQYLLGALLKNKFDIDAEYIAHDGGRQATIDLIGGRLDYTIDDLGSTAPEIKAGTLRPLVSFHKERHQDIPDTPTFKELGYDDLTLAQNIMIVGPKGIPADRVKILHDAIKQVYAEPDFIKMAANVGIEIEYKSAKKCKEDLEAINKIITPLVGKLFPEARKAKK